jgi:hypothetical protein
MCRIFGEHQDSLLGVACHLICIHSPDVATDLAWMEDGLIGARHLGIVLEVLG